MGVERSFGVTCEFPSIYRLPCQREAVIQQIRESVDQHIIHTLSTSPKQKIIIEPSFSSIENLQCLLLINKTKQEMGVVHLRNLQHSHYSFKRPSMNLPI